MKLKPVKIHYPLIGIDVDVYHTMLDVKVKLPGIEKIQSVNTSIYNWINA